MHLPTAAAFLASASLVSSHTIVFNVWVNGVDQGLANNAPSYIRVHPANNPVKDVNSRDMTCNIANKPAAKTLTVKPGDEVAFEWHHDNPGANSEVIASSHKGPVMTYMAPMEKGAAGQGWVKLAEDGLKGGKWGVDRLIQNKGKHSIKVPNVAAGKYLLRPELIGLHEGNRPGGAQFYMECVQVQVQGSGSQQLPAGVNIPGVYKATDPGILFDIYNGATSCEFLPFAARTYYEE